MQAVNVLLECKHIETVEIEAAVFAPKIGELVNCSKHGIKSKILKVSVPFHVSQEKAGKDPGQMNIEE